MFEQLHYYFFEYTVSRQEFLEFLYDIFYIVLFFIYGDWLTTFYAIDKYGVFVESNWIISSLIGGLGLWNGMMILLLLKCLFIFGSYILFIRLKDLDNKYIMMWKCYVIFAGFFGVLLTINNLMFIF